MESKPSGSNCSASLRSSRNTSWSGCNPRKFCTKTAPLTFIAMLLSLSRDSVAQDLTRSCAGEAVALPGNLAVHDHMTIAFGALHAAPFVARKVVRNLDRKYLQPLEV